VLVVAVLLLLQVGQIAGADGYSVYQVTRSMVEDQDFSIPYGAGVVQGEGGDYYSKYGLGLSLLALVPYVLAWPFAQLSGHADVVEQAAVASLMPVIGALLVLALFVSARRLGAGVRASLIVALGATAGTFALTYNAKEFFAEPVVALFVLVCGERLLARRPAQAGAALAFAALVRPQSFALVPLLFLVLYLEGGFTWLRKALLPLAAVLVVTLGYNAIRFGDLTETGYFDEGFTTPFFTGAGHLLFEPSKSLFIFVPAMLAVPFALRATWRTHRGFTLFAIGNLVITFAMTALWHDWKGGWAWGPRLLLPGLLVALVVLAPFIEAAPWRRKAVLASFAVGFVVSASTLLVPTQAQQLDRPLPKYGPEIARQVELIPDKIEYSMKHPFAGTEADHRDYLSLWQVGVMRDLGKPGMVLALGLSAFLLAAVLKSGALLRRRLGLGGGLSAVEP